MYSGKGQGSPDSWESAPLDFPHSQASFKTTPHFCTICKELHTIWKFNVHSVWVVQPICLFCQKSMATIFVYAGKEQTGVELPSVLIISSVWFPVLCVLQGYPHSECQDCPLCLDLHLEPYTPLYGPSSWSRKSKSVFLFEMIDRRGGKEHRHSVINGMTFIWYLLQMGTEFIPGAHLFACLVVSPSKYL